MTLKEYLDEHNESKIAVLMFSKKGKLLPPMEYEPREFESMSKELLNREFMEAVDEIDLVEVYVM